MHVMPITRSESEKMLADAALLHVRLQGHSFFTGLEAFKKASELQALMKELTQVGVPEDHVRLVDSASAVESGLVLKTSSARYVVEIHCAKLEWLGPCLAVIAGQKNTELMDLDWQYSHLEETKERLLRQALKNAKQSAELIAQELSVPLIGIHKVTHHFAGPDVPEMPKVQKYSASQRRSQMVEFAKPAGRHDLETLDVGHLGMLWAKVEVEYLMGPLENND